MKKLARMFAIPLLLAIPSLEMTVAARQQQNNTPLAYIGEIMDSRCAAQGSHDAVMAKEGTKTGKDCALMCIQGGAKFVLYSADTKSSFNLDDQEKPRDYAGEKVTIVGTYDGETKTIHIQSITVTP
jgi:hypothetical protein